MGRLFTVNSLFILLLAVLISTLAYFRFSKTKWEDDFSKQLFITGKDTLPYRYYVPGVNEGEKIPLLIYLHGGGECGNDNEKQLIGGVPYFMIDTIKEKYKCAVFAPQCINKNGWIDSDIHSLSIKMPDKPAKYLAMAFEVIDSLKNLAYIDNSRIYITGFSYGGFGTWDAITRRPDFFAAAAPLCGGGDTSKASTISKVNIWAFHGDKDKVVDMAQTANMVNAIKNNGGNPKMTLYPNTGHYICDKAYTEPGFMKWLFSQTNKVNGN